MTFEDVFRKYYVDLYNFVYHYVMGREQAEDIVQDVFITLMNNFDRLAGEADIRQYLYFIAKNNCMSYFRRCNIADRHNSKLTEAWSFMKKFEYDPVYDHMWDTFESSFKHLSSDQQRILELKLEGKDYKAISEETGLPRHKVHKNIKQAYGKIKSLKSGDILVWLTVAACSFFLF